MKRKAFLILGVLLTCGLGFAGTADEDPDIFKHRRLFTQGVTPTPQQIGSAPYLICTWESAQRGHHALDYKKFRLTFKSDHILLEEIREDANKIPRTGLYYTSAGLLGQVDENFYLSLRWVPGDYLIIETLIALSRPYENDLGNLYDPAITYAKGYAHSYLVCLPTDR